MLKHLRYFLSPFSILVAIFAVLKGNYYPLFFLIAFDVLIDIGDTFLKEDDKPFENPIPFILNSALYINLPLLFLFLSLALFVLVDTNPAWYISFWNYFDINLLDVRSNITFADKCVLLFYFTPLFIATMGTNVGHELTHRKRSRFDMFVGNWSLALSWDCTFAIEHVYGHHKNVGLKDDPATAKRKESLYLFIIRGTIKAHKDAWKIEINRLKRAGQFPLSLKNKMIQGYLRTSALYVVSFYIGGTLGLAIFLLWSFLAKTLLETINYVEHYGLVRVEGEPVLPKHSWNSNHVISSSLLYNLNRHSAHHEKANLKYWELKAYPNAPKLPYGYLRCLYIAYFMPPLFKKIMRSRLKAWDSIYASDAEKKLVEKYS